MTEYYHIKTRRDTAARWAQRNPTPADGEVCLETDTKQKKIGDGVTPYNSLPYDQPGNATSSKAGLMSPSDKQKLDGINLALYAKLNSPSFTGTPTAPTYSYSHDKGLATNAYVLNMIANAAVGLMVRCLFSVPSAGEYTVMATASDCLFIGVNGEGAPITEKHKLNAGINYIDVLFKSSEIIGSNIPQAAFKSVNYLYRVILPERMLKIDDNAFSDCAMLKEVYCLSATPPTLGADVFDNTLFVSGEKLYVHKVFLSEYQSSAWGGLGCTISTL